MATMFKDVECKKAVIVPARPSGRKADAREFSRAMKLRFPKILAKLAE